MNEPPKPRYSFDEDFLRALALDPQRVPMYLRQGRLENDRGKVLMELTFEERKQDHSHWPMVMYRKITALFCAVCQKRADKGLCSECSTKISKSLRRILRDTR